MGGGPGLTEYICDEFVRIANINEMKEVNIVAIDYNAAHSGQKGFPLPIFLETNNTSPKVTMSFTSQINNEGTVCLLASLKEDDNGDISISNAGQIYDLAGAVDNIPGFKLLIQ